MDGWEGDEKWFLGDKIVIEMIEILRGWDVVCNCMGMMWQLVLYWEE